MYIDIHTHQHGNKQENTLQIINVEYAYDFTSLKEYFSYGIHPWDSLDVSLENLDTIFNQVINNENLLAIGECGLDKLKGGDLLLQKNIFQYQIRKANEFIKPLIIHCVKAFGEVLECLSKENVCVPVIFHGFNKSKELAQSIINKGYYISLGKSLKSRNLDDVIKTIPIDHLFLETDNSNICIDEIYRIAAQILNCNVDTLSLQLLSNFNKVFNLQKSYG